MIYSSETHSAPIFPPAQIPARLLLGPGPSNANPCVLAALAQSPIGHLDPAFLDLMSEIQAQLRYVWQTENATTFAISGTGTAAMEATLANTVEPGDVVLVGVKGYFGHRLVDMAQRYGADVRVIHKPWGEAFTLAELQAAVQQHQPAILALVHAETSTGVRQPLEGVADLCRGADCLLLLDTVTSLGGVPVYLDQWGVDMAYSCSQKGLGCPPGASPVTFSSRAVEKLHRRQEPVKNWYLDVSLLEKYWGPEHIYHHTAPVNMYFALHEALRLILAEGLEDCWQRHQQTAQYFWQELERIGLALHVAKPDRLPTLTTVRIPEGVDGKQVAKTLLEVHNIEIGGGLGELGGKVWRIGLMGFNSRKENVDRLLAALQTVLP